MGLLTIAALRAIDASCRIVALAKHPHQQELAKVLGADEILPAGCGQDEALCRQTGATLHQPEIGRPTVLGGFDLVLDCVGSSRSLDDALRFTRRAAGPSSSACPQSLKRSIGPRSGSRS